MPGIHFLHRIVGAERNASVPHNEVCYRVRLACHGGEPESSMFLGYMRGKHTQVRTHHAVSIQTVGELVNSASTSADVQHVVCGKQCGCVAGSYIAYLGKNGVIIAQHLTGINSLDDILRGCGCYI